MHKKATIQITALYSIWLAAFLLPSILAAQVNNIAISDKNTISPQNASTWGIDINNLGYLRNTEYFNRIEKGRTLFGTILYPTLWLQPDENIKLRAGFAANQPLGGQHNIQIQPIITLIIKSKGGDFLFGTIDGATAHRIIEPLFDINTAIEHRFEQGAQYRIDREALFTDIWINWQNHMPYKGTEHERFTAGINFQPTFAPVGTASITPSAQILLRHKGGQLSSDTTNQYTALSAAIGARLELSVSEKHRVFISPYFLISNTQIHKEAPGNAWLVNLGWERKGLSVSLSWFKGENFTALEGTPIYQSQSFYDAEYYQPNRQLLFMRIAYDYTLHENLALSARTEPYFDFETGKTEFSYSLYLLFQFGHYFQID